MNISTLIAVLQTLKATSGDLPVVLHGESETPVAFALIDQNKLGCLQVVLSDKPWWLAE